jgi:hypothetical protein
VTDKRPVGISGLENEWNTTKDVLIDGLKSTFQTMEPRLSRAHADSNGLSGANLASSLPRICLVYAKPQGHTANLPGLNINRPPWPLASSFEAPRLTARQRTRGPLSHCCAACWHCTKPGPVQAVRERNTRPATMQRNASDSDPPMEGVDPTERACADMEC